MVSELLADLLRASLCSPWLARLHVYVNRKRVFFDDTDHCAHAVCSKIDRRVYVRVLFNGASSDCLTCNEQTTYRPHFILELGDPA